MKSRTLLMLSGLMLGLCGVMAKIAIASSGRDYWWQFSPGGHGYALKVRGGIVSLYRVNPGGRPGGFPPTITEFWIYYLAVTVLFIAFILLVLGLNRRKSPAGECATCGYDLRASPERCPECGAMQTAKLTG